MGIQKLFWGTILKVLLTLFLQSYSFLIFYGQRCDSIARLGEVNYQLNNDLQALKNYRNAVECFKGAGNRLAWLRAARMTNHLIKKNREFDEASKYLDTVILEFGIPKTKEESHQLAQVHVLNGFNNEKLRNYSDAYFHYKKSIVLIGDFCEGINYWECFDKQYIARYILHNLGNIYQRIGEYERMILEIPDAFIERLDLQESGEDIAVLYMHKGIAYMNLSKLDSALFYFKRVEEIPDLNNYTLALVYLNRGNVFRLKKDRNSLLKALDSFENSDELAKGVEEEKSINLISENNLYKSLVYRELKRFPEALVRIDSSLLIARRLIKDSLHNSFSNHYLLAGKIQDSMDNVMEALKFYHLAIKASTPGFLSENYNELPSPFQLNPERNLIDALVGKANIWSSSSGEDITDESLNRALLAHKLAIKVEDQIRGIYLNQASRRRVGETRNERTSTALNIAYDLWIRKPNNSLATDILFHMEKNRAQELRRELEKNKQSEEEIEQLKTTLRMAQYSYIVAKRKMDSLQYLEVKKTEEEERLSHLLEEAEIRRNRLREKLDIILKETYSDYYVNNSQYAIVSLPKFQETLDSTEAFLSFFNSEDNLFAAYMSKGSFDFKKISLDKKFKDSLDSLKRLIRKPILSRVEKVFYEEAAFQLYQTLLLPIENWNVKRIIVTSCPILYDLPLEVLLSKKFEDNELNNYHKWAYLWKKYEVCYAYSATLFGESGKMLETPNLDYLGFAPDYGRDNFNLSSFRTSDKSEVSELKYNSLEVLNTLSIFEDLGSTGDAFFSYEADKEAFQKVGNLSNILHLALHAFGGLNSDQYPYLLFAPDSDSAQVNIASNRLYANEVPNMDFSTELLILSACNSGLGKVVSGEGVMNFGRAFRMAGVLNTVMSLWEVDDYASSEIIPYFISNLKTGMNKSRALNEARKIYLENSSQGNRGKAPYFWAHFILVGNPDPILIQDSQSVKQSLNKFYKEYPSLYIIIFGCLVFLLSYTIYRNATEIRFS